MSDWHYLGKSPSKWVTRDKSNNWTLLLVIKSRNERERDIFLLWFFSSFLWLFFHILLFVFCYLLIIRELLQNNFFFHLYLGNNNNSEFINYYSKTVKEKFFKSILRNITFFFQKHIKSIPYRMYNRANIPDE